MKYVIKKNPTFTTFLSFLPDKAKRSIKRIINVNLVFQLNLHPLNLRLFKINLNNFYENLKNEYLDLKFRKIIEKHAKIKDFFFIQIGSNDGKLGDPIHEYIIKYNWHGILIEPVRYIFNKLLRTYEKQKNLIFENIAISNENQIRIFYRLKENKNGLPILYEQLGSFLPEIVLKHKKFIPNIENYILKEKVNCITFNYLIQKYNVKKLDLLHIDAEGYDYEIIKSIDFTKIKPKMILYEHIHLSSKDKKQCQEFLKNKGYFFLIEPFNILAYSR